MPDSMDIVVAEPISKIQVILKDPTVVAPDAPTRNHVMYLSNIDQTAAITQHTIYVYRANPTKNHGYLAKAIRESLSKILVPYYPLAGRLQINLEGRLEVNCNGKGAVFVEAEADATISYLENYTEFGKPDPELMQLVYLVPEAKNQEGMNQLLVTPPLVVQMTRFRCGGFVLGLGVNHAFVDGTAAMQFINAWAAIARGDSTPLKTPFLDRTILRPRSPIQIDFPHHECDEIVDLSKDLSDDDFVYNIFYFTRETLTELRRQTLEKPGGYVSKCSTFETLAAHVWRARTKALGMEPSQITRLLMAVDVRSKFVPPIPSDYVGNSIYDAYAMTTAYELLSKPLSYAVRLIQEGIALITDKYLRSAIDYLQFMKMRPSLMDMPFMISKWSRLAFYETDFGWGKPIYCGPVTRGREMVFFTMPDGNEGGKNLKVMIGLPPRVMEKFEEAIRLPPMVVDKFEETIRHRIHSSL